MPDTIEIAPGIKFIVADPPTPKPAPVRQLVRQPAPAPQCTPTRPIDYAETGRAVASSVKQSSYVVRNACGLW